MKLIIDLRIPNSKTDTRDYSVLWVQAYVTLYPEDDVFWIGFEGTQYGDFLLSIPHLLISPNHGWIENWKSRQRLQSVSGDCIFSFSEESILPKKIPIIRHMCTYDTLLTPEVYITPPFAKDTFVLVSSPSKKREFIERFMLEDTQIVVLPNWIPEIIKGGIDDSILQSYNIKKPYILHDMGFHTETQLEKIISYWKKHSPRYQLIILGEMNTAYERYRDLIREYELFDTIRIVGVLPAHHLDRLYQEASGWIYIGYHYSGSLSLLRALGYNLPLILSDLEDFRDLPGAKINHHRREIEEDIEALLAPNRTAGTNTENNDILIKTRDLFEKIGKKERKS